MSIATTPVRVRRQSDETWLRLVQLSIAVILAPLAILAVTGTFFTTITGGDFRYAADYWYTAVGLPITLAGIGIALGLHKLQHGADGRLGRIGLVVTALALTELFAQLLASVLVGAEVRWGPSYPVCALLSFLGLALLAAGSWRSGLVPRWMLGVWPPLWLIGSLAAQGLTPVLLIVFLVGFGLTLTRRVRGRA